MPGRTVFSSPPSLRVSCDKPGTEAEEDLVGDDAIQALALPRRRGGGARIPEGRFLTRVQLTRLLAEIPEQWQLFFNLLASTGLRVSEAIALRWRDLELDRSPHLCVRRSIVEGVLGEPKSRYGFRRVPLARQLALQLAERRASEGEEDLVFRGPRGAPVNPNNARYRVLAPALERAGGASSGRLSRTPPHLCFASDRAWPLALTPTTVDGPPLRRLHDRRLRAPNRCGAIAPAGFGHGAVSESKTR
jgi:integrase